LTCEGFQANEFPKTPNIVCEIWRGHGESGVQKKRVREGALTTGDVRRIGIVEFNVKGNIKNETIVTLLLQRHNLTFNPHGSIPGATRFF
jgi:hypothetical protein